MPMTEEEKKARRNKLQRARRASPEAKAKEAAASRASKARKEVLPAPPAVKWVSRTVSQLLGRNQPKTLIGEMLVDNG